MAVISYKCPNCGGDLKFDPQSQKFHCEFCSSDFTLEEVEKANPQQQETKTAAEQQSTASEQQNAETEQGNTASEQTGGDANVYSCPSCGAEIVTDATTAATFCYYCHNPVVLQGKLSGEYQPDRIIPFEVDKDEAQKSFLSYVKTKRFVPKSFFCKEQIEKISGIYFPFWEYDCEEDGRWQGEGTQLRVYQMGDIEYTETKIYQLERGAHLTFEDLTRNALNRENKELVEAVQPFRLDSAKPFAMGYLSGFQAEKRDIEKKDLEAELRQEVQEHAAAMVRSSVGGYNTIKTTAESFRPTSEKWKYLLVPVWVVTYKGGDGKTYYYAMNGQTRKICGVLPIDKKRVAGLFFGIFFVLFVLLLLGGYFLW